MGSIIELGKAKQLASENKEFAIRMSTLHVNAKIKEASSNGRSKVTITNNCLFPSIIKELQDADYVVHPANSGDYDNMEQDWVIYWGYNSDKDDDTLFDEGDKDRAFTS